MFKGSINGAIKKGLGPSSASDRQASSAFEKSRKRREEFIQKKRGRMESLSSNDLRSNVTNYTDPSRLQEYAAVVLTEDPSNVNEAVRHIRRLLSQKDGIYVDDVISTGIVPKLVYYLSLNELPKLQFESVWALTNIASGESNQTAVVVQAGSIEPLLKLLQSPQLEVQEQAVWALGNISGDCDEYREYIFRCGGFDSIIQLAQQNLDKLGIVKNCIWCISNLCRYQQQKEFMFSYVQPWLPFLQQILKYNKIEVVTDACWAFSFLTDAPPAQKKVVMGYINSLDLMRYILYPNTHLQCPALRIAGNIVSGDKEDTQRMLDAGLVSVLVKILPSAQELQKKEILWIISNIAAGTPKQIKMLIDSGLIRELIHIINTEIDMLQIEALWAISNAINGGNEEQIRYIVEKQALPPLVRSLPKVSNIILKKHILVSLYRILKVGDHTKQHCKMEKNPYLEFFLEIGGDERVSDCFIIDNRDIQEVCRHILKRCDTQENQEEILPNI